MLSIDILAPQVALANQGKGAIKQTKKVRARDLNLVKGAIDTTKT